MTYFLSYNHKNIVSGKFAGDNVFICNGYLLILGTCCMPFRSQLSSRGRVLGRQWSPRVT